MSTTFAIFKNKPNLDDNKCVVCDKYDEDIDYVIIARRVNNYIYLQNNIEVLINHLGIYTYVYPIDNAPNGIYCVADILKELD